MNTKLNKQDALLLSIYFTISLSLSAVDYYKRDALLREYIFDYPVEILNVVTCIYIFLHYLIPSFVIKRKRYLYFAFWGLLTMIVMGSIEYTVGYWSGKNDWTKFPNFLTLCRFAIDTSAREMALPFALLLTKKFYEGQTELLKSQKQQKENELKLLRSQIDPHFLFNNLNTLDSLIDSDSEKAKEYINRLSLIYRYLIQTKDAEVMELSEELQFVENYIFLIQTRFGDDYHFTIDKKADIEDKFIPTGALQTLLENVVKHNKPQGDSGIVATITIEENLLRVVNSKLITISKNSLGTGLDNLRSRYKLLSDKEITVINTQDSFKVSIPIINLSKDV